MKPLIDWVFFICAVKIILPTFSKLTFRIIVPPIFAGMRCSKSCKFLDHADFKYCSRILSTANVESHKY